MMSRARAIQYVIPRDSKGEFITVELLNERIGQCATPEQLNELFDDVNFIKVIDGTQYEHIRKPEVCLLFNQICDKNRKRTMMEKGFNHFLCEGRLDYLVTFKDYINVDHYFTLHLSFILNSTLERVATDANMDIINYLFNEGLDVNTLDCYDKSMLFHACRNKRIELIDLLLRKGINVNHRSKLSLETALFSTVRSGEVQVVDRLILYGVDLSPPANSINESPIYVAASSGHVEIVQRLIDMRVSFTKKEFCKLHIKLLVKLDNNKVERVAQLRKIIAILIEDGHKKPTREEIIQAINFKYDSSVSRRLIPLLFQEQ